jgi:hypothetical protein
VTPRRYLSAAQQREVEAALDEQLAIVSLDEFVAVEEEGAAALVGELGEAFIPEDGDVLVYGDGGAGKTTLMIDAACHWAAGDAWLGMPVGRPLRVLLVENEGPRPLFRAKLRRKRAGWTGSPLDDRVSVLESPWARFSFSAADWREWLATAIVEREIDVVIAGPVTRIGFKDAGTLSEVRDFLGLVSEVRHLAARPVTFVLVHHENKGGKVSGAWEGSGDTLLHVSGQAHGRTRVYVQKARWASSRHATTLQLVWTPGEGFALAEAAETTDEEIREGIVAAVAASPGTAWGPVVKATPGVGTDRRMAIRDGLLAARTIVNVTKIGGVERALDHCEEGKRACLYVADDPAIWQLLPEPGTVVEQSAPAPGAGIDPQPFRAPHPKGGAGGTGAAPHPSLLDAEAKP